MKRYLLELFYSQIAPSGKLLLMSALASDLNSALPTVLLWAGASLLAVMLLGRAMLRRRESLTQTLKQHVSKTIGTVDGGAGDEQAKE